ncbi:DUF4426 domain-containing protein [Geopseudomonas guangdongensis]|uniref:DUF4426 domain-containing protein n=1 Tax=Geopseudomonas guangdongensis TaxID=1245526 RepID=A0A1H2EUS8_9GAMM|nr:DUF4426 domain-containing protein [Pseudomonas guangdongensis]MBP9955956.1 DUF4426 domain-containing protein [Pseudomonas sp.]SDT98809.1 protein of unknown function [Pseudomonas guangdongensis]
MRRLTLFLLSLCLALPAAAERLQRFGDLEVHYSVFNSSFLQPDIATAAGLTRSKTQGVLNVAVLRDGKAVPAAQVSGEVKNLLGQTQSLRFRRVTEGEAAYHLSQFKMTDREVLTFNLKVQEGGVSHSLTFNQEVFPDE